METTGNLNASKLSPMPCNCFRYKDTFFIDIHKIVNFEKKYEI